MLDKLANDIRTSVELAAGRFRTLDLAWVREPVGPGKWSRLEILGHLLDSAANNHQRFVRAQVGEELHFPGYDQDAWVERQGYGESSWADLIELWVRFNLHLAHVIAYIPEPALSTPCRIGAGDPVALGQLVEDYVLHLRHHIAQIDRA